MNKPIKQMLLLLCALLAMVGCGPKEQIKALTHDLTGGIKTIDPQFSVGESASTVIANTFEGLTRLSETGEAQGACAERWSISADGLTYTFTLRDNLRWADGTPLVSQDFAFALRRLFGAIPSPAARDFIMIQNAAQILSGELSADALAVSTPDEKTLVIRLTTPHASFPAMLARTAAMPCQERFFNEQKGRYGLSETQTRGNGPFLVESWSERAVVLVKNPNYRKAVTIDRVSLYLNRGDPVELFLAGKSDGVLAAFRRLPELKQHVGSLSYDQSWVLLLNTAEGSCADLAVRQALVSALDLERINALLPPEAIPTEGIIPRDAPLAESTYRKLAGYPRRAPSAENPRQLLRDALSRLGLSDVGRLTVLVSEFEPGPSIGGQLQKSWQQELSAFINMEQLPYEELLTRVQNDRYSIAIAPLVAQGKGTTDFLSRFSEMESADAPTRAADELSLAGLLEQAHRKTDPAAVAADLLAVEQRLIDDFVVVPLFDAPSSFVLRDGVEGVRYDAVSHTVYFADATIR